MSLEDERARYLRALHAMQTAVKFEIAAHEQSGRPADSASSSPKHLRVGVNSAMVGQLALTNLLIEKGVFTPEEYFRAQADAMEEEAAEFQARAPRGVHFH